MTISSRQVRVPQVALFTVIIMQARQPLKTYITMASITCQSLEATQDHLPYSMVFTPPPQLQPPRTFMIMRFSI